jgi:hypothetical protein
MSALKADRLALLDGISSVAIVNPVAKATAAAQQRSTRFFLAAGMIAK